MTESNSENSQPGDKKGKQSSKNEAGAKASSLEQSFLKTSLATSNFPHDANHISNPYKILYDAKTRHGLNPIFLPFFEPVPAYAFTALIFDQGTTVPLPGLNTFQTLEFPSQDELIKDLTSHINECATSFARDTFNVDLQEVIGFTNDPSIDYSNIIHEEPSYPEHTTLSPSNTSLADHAFGLVGDYENTGHICDDDPQILKPHSNALTPPFIKQTLRLEAKNSQVQTEPYPETLQVCAGSFTDFSVEAPMPFTTEHILERPQMEEWLHQSSAKNMTLAEQLEMNRHAWAE